MPAVAPTPATGSGSGSRQPAAGSPLVSPPGGPIERIAVTDTGDAALTSDANDRLRLWPTLDGTREPVVIHGHAPRALALAHDGGDGFVGAILDAAGDVEVLAIAGSGRVTAKTEYDGLALAIAPLATGVLVLRDDRTLAWVDRTGAARRPALAPDPGTRTLAIAARRGGAIALLAKGEARLARAIDLHVDGALAWHGAAAELPATTAEPATLALAPGHARFATIDRTGREAVVYAFAAGDRADVFGRAFLLTIGEGDIPSSAGFLDDDRAVFGTTGEATLWRAERPNPPAPVPDISTGAVPPLVERGSGSGSAGSGSGSAGAKPPAAPPLEIDARGEAAIGDGVAVASNGAILAVHDGARVRYLGYRELATLAMATDSGLPTLALSGHTLWLAPHLVALRTTPADDAESGTLLALDDHHVIRAVGDQLRARDIATGTEVVITDHRAANPELVWERGSRVLAIRGAGAQRYQLDAAFAHVEKLASIEFSGDEYPGLRLCDPARSGGLVAMTIGILPDTPGLAVVRFRADPHAAKKLMADPRVQLPEGMVIGSAPNCDLYVHDPKRDTVQRLAAGDAHAVDIMQLPDARSADANRSATALVVVTGDEAVALDLPGGSRVESSVRWRIPVWRPQNAMWTGDDRSVTLATGSGMLELDAATGKRTAAGCGWHFGLYADLPNVGASGFATPTACEDEDAP